ncbi:MAG: NUDIX domain-containing protein [Candidatus Bathyarchaeota archaeon]
MQEDLQEKNVVTNFLIYKGKLLILKRSEKVGTYRGKWAGLSGYIEQGETSHQTAFKEIFEETSLTSQDIEFMKKSEAFSFPDRKRKTLWKIHPYLFRLKNPVKIRTDWEHSKMKWIDPEDIGRYDTVPSLPETFESVYDGVIFKKINSIRTDKHRGASQLSREALNILKCVLERDNSKTCEDFLVYFKQVGKELVESRPTMAPIANIVGHVIYEVSEKVEEKLKSLKSFANNKIEELYRNSELALEKTSDYAANLINNSDVVFTCSYSSTLCATFRKAKLQEKNFNVIVAESVSADGILHHGKTMAEQLEHCKVLTEIIADDTIENQVHKANKILVGADNLLPNGTLINGAPTHRLALTAKKHSVPFYVVCETSKFSLFDRTPRLEKGFDLIEPALLTGIVTENGVIHTGDVIKYAEEMERYVKYL